MYAPLDNCYEPRRGANKFCNCIYVQLSLNAIANMTSYSTYWIIYTVVLTLIFIINCALSQYALIDVEISIKIFTITAFLPTPIYLIESILTRSKYIEIFSDIKNINTALSSTSRKHVMQLSMENIIKIIFVLSMFTVQLAIISVKCFIYGTFDLNM